MFTLFTMRYGDYLRPLLLALVSSLIVTTTAVATDAGDPPRQLLQQLSEQLFDRLQQQREQIRQQPQQLFDIADQLLVPHVDLARMNQWVMGRYWRQATADQQQRFAVAFRTLLIRFYVAALLEQPDQLDQLLARRDRLISYLPSTPLDERRAQVRAQVELPDNPQPVKVLFSLLRQDQQWLIYDVNVEGVSVVSNYRNNFASEIQRGGIESLIVKLEQRNQALLQQVNGTHN